jgi:arabinogalactan oligomer/maltooligosaccharide transport system permease protein
MKNEFFEKKDGILKVVLCYVILTVMSFICLYPILNILSISLRPGSRLFQTTLQLYPDNATLENFRIAIFERDFGLWLWNSLKVSAATTILAISFSFSAAYAFSRYKFKGRDATLTSFLLTQIFPAPMLLLPIFILLRYLGWLDTHIGLVIPYVAGAVPFCVWTMKGFFDTVPYSIEESAYIDGASLFQIFFRIITPLSLPAIGVTSLFAFTGAWNEYIMARQVISSDALITLPLALTNMQGQFNTEWGVFAAASIMTALPVMVVFIALSKFMVGGLTLGGVKG